jgi:hypothetical protein
MRGGRKLFLTTLHTKWSLFVQKRPCSRYDHNLSSKSLGFRPWCIKLLVENATCVSWAFDLITNYFTDFVRNHLALLFVGCGVAPNFFGLLHDLEFFSYVIVIVNVPWGQTILSRCVMVQVMIAESSQHISTPEANAAKQ